MSRYRDEVRLDPDLFANPKVAGLNPRTVGVFVLGLVYCANTGSGGKIPGRALQSFGGRNADAAALVDAGLWHRNGRGWLVHDWGEWNPPPPDDPEERRRWFAAQRARKWRRRQRRNGAGPDQWDNLD